MENFLHTNFAQKDNDPSLKLLDSAYPASGQHLGSSSGFESANASLSSNPIAHLNSADTILNKLSREKELISSLPSTALEGFKSRVEWANNHKLATAAELAGAVALGAGLSILSKNPEVMGKAMTPVVKFGLQNAGNLFTALTAVDVGRRVAVPVLDTWNRPHSLEANKKILGYNIGSMAFDYPIAIGGAYAGSKLGNLMNFSSVASTPELKVETVDAKSQLKLNETVQLQDGTIASKLPDRIRYMAKNGIEVSEFNNGNRIVELPSGDLETSTLQKESVLGRTYADKQFKLVDGTQIDLHGAMGQDLAQVKGVDGKTTKVSIFDLFQNKNTIEFDFPRIEMQASDPRIPQGTASAPIPTPEETTIKVGDLSVKRLESPWPSMVEGIGGNRYPVDFVMNETMSKEFASADLIYSRLDGSKVYQWLPDFMKKPIAKP